MAIVMEAAYAFIAPAGPSIVVLAATAVFLFHRRSQSRRDHMDRNDSIP